MAMFNTQQSAANGGKKKLERTVNDLIQRPSPGKHELCLTQKLIAAWHMGQVQVLQNLARAVMGTDKCLLERRQLGCVQRRCDGERNPLRIEICCEPLGRPIDDSRAEPVLVAQNLLGWHLQIPH